ncbi:uncharacterized protein Z520_11526 [Fonsecaea multimorphosa CBS 102226]|uniref:Alcohol dehydrogenase-like N-terminal domain-containing protein n=1 Tax=Fonsecaea multimorphosa CBS 102226 TaxID=1442371 RepID=A0A0D2JQA2_9EURO|nr:uncharacterized protein Z520_11526 [Fonsecaea multimorphosa CBS 102226]KIX92674.1 hypothetical protein Z520_11526 [Fonsecaea multimorphosa CBS 102226]OAL18005.1 hypothetical protein AYO22_11073 [Fonsecaea multimorphosa]
MTPKNQAAILPSPKAPALTISSAPYSPPSSGEVVIRAHAVAINPADCGIQRLGILIPEEGGYPCVLGCDVAGEVVELPPGGETDERIAHLKVGDRVIGQTSPLRSKDSKDLDLSEDDDLEQWRGKKVYAYSSFQKYVVLLFPFVAKIPDTMTYEDAVVLPLGVNTASSCLFPEVMLGLDMPPAKGGAEKKGKTLIVWGASSSVGSCGVQLAVQAGYTVVGICSQRNHQFVKSLGAEECFDQSDPNIVESVVSYLKREGQEIVGAYDAISKPPTLQPLCDILHGCGSTGRNFIASVFPGADQYAKNDVSIVTNLSAVSSDDFTTNLATKVYQWLETALEDHRMQCMPAPEVMGKGLESVQAAMDKLASGTVSGRKLVVTL